jgi:hypothetical protein
MSGMEEMYERWVPVGLPSEESRSIPLYDIRATAVYPGPLALIAKFHDRKYPIIQ